MESDLIGQGLELMLAGMGTVFLFLTLLVLATALMSRVVLRLQPIAARSGASPRRDEAEEVAAIAAAIELHRRRR